MLNFIIAQIEVATNAIATPVTPAAAAPPTLNILDLIIKGGVIMIPIALLSVLLVYVFVTRLLVVNKALATDANFVPMIKSQLQQGNVEAAKNLAQTNTTPVGIMLYKGIVRLGKPVKEIEMSMENSAKVELAKVEVNVNYLSTIAAIAPMFGFLGTIFGVIKIFYNIAIADNISIGLIAGGLYEKMITSAAGLVIGVMAFVAHHLLVARIDKLIAKLELASAEFLDVITEPAGK
jgi:biopolymer transport protein ExbB